MTIKERFLIQRNDNESSKHTQTGHGHGFLWPYSPAPATLLCVKDSLEDDTQYRFTFVELYDKNATQTQWDPDRFTTSSQICNQSLALEPMTQFTATTVEKRSLSYPNSCTSWQLQIDDLTMRMALLITAIHVSMAQATTTFLLLVFMRISIWVAAMPTGLFPS